jgi:CDP-glucose 4,6-dehydratase
MVMDLHFWKGKKVLVTGHTGFKGSWLSLLLQQLGSEVIGVSLPPETSPNLFEATHCEDGMVSIYQDLRDAQKVTALLEEHQPETVFHLAAQALVRRSYDCPVETYATNVMGTLHVLEAIRKTNSVRAAVIVTSDKCYENLEQLQGYVESDAMGGYDPYSSSKGCAELLTASYRNSYFPSANYKAHKTAIATARAGNVIGGGDWSEDRLIPDVLGAFAKNETVHLRSPSAIRPWQHVLEPLVGYLCLANRLYVDGEEYAEPWNFGPDACDAKPVDWVVKNLAELWGGGADWGVDGENHVHEAHYLKLDSAKAKTRLDWVPRWELLEALERIVHWHKKFDAGEDAKQLCLLQIEEYLELVGQCYSKK